jgi:FkbM family methyltransferase
MGDASPEKSPRIYTIRKLLPGFAPRVVFDVGANLGQSARVLLAAFPDATLYAFEPVESTFDALAANLAGEPRAQLFNLALGRRTGEAYVTARAHSPTNRLVEAPTFFARRKLERVAVVAGDGFCADHGIERIGFLKVDAEGHDLDVLIGFQRMLTEMRIDLLEAEVGMSVGNPLHVPFEAVKAFLEPIGYHLFHIYEQAMDTFFSGRPVLRRANAAFVSTAFVEANRVAPRSRQAS